MNPLHHDTLDILSAELDWLCKVINERIAYYLKETKEYTLENYLQDTSLENRSWKEEEELLDPPTLGEQMLWHQYAMFIRKHELNMEERLIVLMSLAIYLKPNFYHIFLKNPWLVERAKLHRTSGDKCLLPTVETALFILAGDDITERTRVMYYFETEHFFYRHSVLDITPTEPNEPDTFGLLSLSLSYRSLFIYNIYKTPRYSHRFPATFMETNLQWSDLVLSQNTALQIDELKIALNQDEYFRSLRSGKHMRKGLRILFYGEPGTGKTLTATLLGKELNMPVIRVEISGVQSKYIGETNERLESLFNTAENKNWILFIDEGDAILGQRSQSDQGESTAHANDTVAFLLQRIESYNGIIVVATNFIQNLDKAYERRFDINARFHTLSKQQQYQFWLKLIPEEYPLDKPQMLLGLLDQYGFSPAEICNVNQRVLRLIRLENLDHMPFRLIDKTVQDNIYRQHEMGGQGGNNTAKS